MDSGFTKNLHHFIPKDYKDYMYDGPPFAECQTCCPGPQGSSICLFIVFSPELSAETPAFVPGASLPGSQSNGDECSSYSQNNVTRAIDSRGRTCGAYRAPQNHSLHSGHRNWNYSQSLPWTRSFIHLKNLNHTLEFNSRSQSSEHCQFSNVPLSSNRTQFRNRSHPFNWHPFSNEERHLKMPSPYLASIPPGLDARGRTSFRFIHAGSGTDIPIRLGHLYPSQESKTILGSYKLPASRPSTISGRSSDACRPSNITLQSVWNQSPNSNTEPGTPPPIDSKLSPQPAKSDLGCLNDLTVLNLRTSSVMPHLWPPVQQAAVSEVTVSDNSPVSNGQITMGSGLDGFKPPHCLDMICDDPAIQIVKGQGRELTGPSMIRYRSMI